MDLGRERGIPGAERPRGLPERVLALHERVAVGARLRQPGGVGAPGVLVVPDGRVDGLKAEIGQIDAPTARRPVGAPLLAVAQFVGPPEIEVELAHAGGLVAGVDQQRGDRRQRVAGVHAVGAHAVARGVVASHQRGPRAHAERIGHVPLGEAHPLGREAVDGRRPDEAVAVAAEGVAPLRVGEHQEHVWALVRTHGVTSMPRFPPILAAGILARYGLRSRTIRAKDVIEHDAGAAGNPRTSPGGRP